ncbi:MAG: PAS and helix-turn-helix domain-containing protein [Deltaproteobacteria bacterium]|jgi:PAS domain S-box-containing protein|nr:PAS and helix-turn-helix domain-containing protein [Syntrophaceae bacterium]
METNRLVQQLREWEKDIFEEWLRRMRASGCVNSRITNREDFSRRFAGVMAALDACDQEPQSSRPAQSDDDRQCLAEPLIDEARFGRERGMDLEFFLGYFKTLISCIEKRLIGMTEALPRAAELVLKLRQVADFTELTVIAGWRAAGPDRTPRRTLNSGTSDKLLGAIFMSVGEGILLVDEDGEIVRANQHACEIYGLQEQNIVGADIRSLLDEAGAGLLMRYCAEMAEGQRRHAEVTCLYVDGKTFPAAVTVTRSDLDGRKYWSLIVRDDTQQKAMEKQLREDKQQVEDMNRTLKTVMKSIEQDRRDFESRVAAKIKTSLLPGLKKIDAAAEASVRKSYLAILEEQLVSLTAGFEKELDPGLLKLSRTEIEVCRLIQAGSSGKEICDAMKLSFETVQTHRRNIRRKLGLNGEKMNLHAFLMNRVL